MKKTILFIFIFSILLTSKTYAPKENHSIKKPTTSKIETFNENQDIVKEDIVEEIIVRNEPNNNSIDEIVGVEETEDIFTSNYLTDEIIGRISGNSYKENDKIKLEDLSYLQISYWGFDGKENIGEMIVNMKVANQVLEIFKELYKVKFPIEKIRLIDDYDAEDELSMKDNNTSAFCYREIAESKEKLSKHSYGIAIDINPVQNPYIKNNIVLPEKGKDYLDRTNLRKGMIVKDDPCYEAFTERGWIWGGDWNSLKDYQHFEFQLD